MTISRFLAVGALGSASALALACGGGSSGGYSEGSHPSFPTITQHGVNVVATPKVVAITFNGDANAAAIESFVSSFGTTSWWQTVTKDYGVGTATGSSVAVTGTLATSYTDDPSGTNADGSTPTFPKFVTQTLSQNASIPAPDANTIYAFYMPASSPITLQGAQTCQAAGGYHSSTTTSDGKTVLYAVIPECANATLGSRKFDTETDFLTFASSHEILEAATDPTAAFAQDGTLHAGFYTDLLGNTKDDLAWNVMSDGEVADYCVDQFGFSSYSDTTKAGSFLVQRSWSTSAASAGKNPCVPVPSGEVYFNAGPAEGSDIFIVAENTATDLTIQAFSDGPTSAWSVVALDGAVAQGQAAQLTMSFAGGSMETEPGLKLSALPAASVSNGTSVKLSVTLTATLDVNTNPVAPGILISHDGASLVGAKTDHYWPFLVTTQAIATQLGISLKTPPGLRAMPSRSFPSLLRGLRIAE